MGKEAFVIYKSFYKPISKLSDKQLGRLFRAIFEYNINGVVSVEEDIEMAFEFFKNQFEIDEEKYQSKVERNRENGRRGGNKAHANEPNENEQMLPNDSERYQSLPNATQNKRTQANQADKDKDKDKDKELDKSNKARARAREEQFSFIAPEYRETFNRWIKYKRERKESYKTAESVKECYDRLVNLSGNDPVTADLIVKQSMANNWAGLFELKQNKQNGNNSSSQDRKNFGTSEGISFKQRADVEI